jgi:hypothetical protein
MAQGDSKLYRDAVLKLNEGAYSEGDTWTLAFVSDTYSTLNADATNPVLADVTVTSGGNVNAAYNLANFAITRATTTITFDADDIGTITKDAANPSDVRCAVLYNNTSASDDLIQAWDLTTDGSTALDLVNNDFTFSFGASGILTATVA